MVSMAQPSPAEVAGPARSFDALREILLSPLAIGFLTALCIVCNRLRFFAGVQPEYGFMVTNLFLAWIPLTLAYAISWTARRQLTRPVLPLLACAWILFLPNAPYLVTDIVHLHRGEANLVNALQLSLLALCGLLIAVKSVQLVQSAVESLWGVSAGWRAVQAIIVLATVGVYVGRVLRWYSWTLLQHPHELERSLERAAFQPARVLLGVVGIAVFAGAFYVVYRVLTGPREDTLAPVGHISTL
jgi:uncharacterized membrane protein